MKPQHFAALVGSLLLIAVVLVATGAPQPQPGAQVLDPGHAVTVIGEGEVQVKPNTVLLTFGITTAGASARDAEASRVALIQQVKTALTTAGMEENSLAIMGTTVSPTTYQDFAGRPQVTGYQAQALVTGRLKNLSRLQTVIDAGLTAGAASLESMRYTLEDPEVTKQQAMAKALENARTRARALTKAGGNSMGDLLTVEVLPELEPKVEDALADGLLYKARVKATFAF